MIRPTTPDPIEEIFDRHERGRAASNAEAERLRRLVARHMKRIEGLPAFHAGTALQELASLVTEMTGMEARVSGPFGMTNDYGMTVNERSDVTAAHFTFRPCGDRTRVEMVDHESDNGRHPGDSLGRMNGMHRNTLPMPGIERMLEMIEEQRAERRLMRMVGTAD